MRQSLTQLAGRNPRRARPSPPVAGWGTPIPVNHESPIRGETFVTRKIARAVARITLALQETICLGMCTARAVSGRRAIRGGRYHE